MTEDKQMPAEDKQMPEGPGDPGPSENLDSNEKADDQVEIQQPDGSPAPRAD